MSSPADAALDRLLRGSSAEGGIDPQELAALLDQVARDARPRRTSQPAGASPVDPGLEQLRRLLLGREIDALERIEALLGDRERLAAAVGGVLPAAIAQATGDGRLGPALAPAIEKATESSIRTDPRTLVGILQPLIAPAIRKSIGEAIDGTFQSLNEALRHSLTWRGLRWRWEAWRTGVPFAEVVLRHTLVYRIEHVFLIHQHTGLMIAHAAAENAAGQDPQLVSSMLVAIQDFVRDSFTGADQQALDALRLGELRLWSEAGPCATLVAVIRGNPPEDLRGTLRRTLERIHEERHQALEDFDGDSSGFGDVEAQLAECAALEQRAQAKVRAGFPWYAAAFALALLASASAGVWQWWEGEVARAERQRIWAEEQRHWDDAVGRLRLEPGIVVTEAERRGGRFLVAGLRDPLATDPRRVIKESGVDPARVDSRWTPYETLEPEFMLRRLQASLEPPESVDLSVENGDVIAQGSAPAAWIDRARVAARLLPAGGPRLDISRVQDADAAAKAKLRDLTESVREAIESREIRFDTNESLPAAGQEAVLDMQARDLKHFSQLAATLKVPIRVTLTGHADDVGRGTFNLSLSSARAAAVLALLKKRGVDSDLLVVRGAGTLEPLETGSSPAARSANRRVSFTVSIEGQ